MLTAVRTENQSSDWPALPHASLFVIGLGLMGASLAAAARARNICREVTGWDADQAVVSQALALGHIDRGIDSLSAGVQQADVLVLAVPVLALADIIDQLGTLDSAGKIITDLGSCKEILEAAARQDGGFPLAGFVPGHPLAGSEKSGCTAASAALYEGCRVILSPLPETAPPARALVLSLWEKLGAVQVLEMPAVNHDQVLAFTSHLPHVLAFCMMLALDKDATPDEVWCCGAGALDDLTRVAASSPVMWHDILVSNREAVLAAVDSFSREFDFFRRAIAAGDSQALLRLMGRASDLRRHLSKPSDSKTFNQCVSRTRGTHSTMVHYKASPAGALAGKIRVPGDKSISHRALILGALAEGESCIDGLLESEDVYSTLHALRNLGVSITEPDQGSVKVDGLGAGGLKPPCAPLDMGNAGTAMRLLIGVLAAQGFDATLTGDASLSSRPMGRVVDPLRQMGAHIETAARDLPPVRIQGGHSLQGIDYTLPIPSAQVKSCLLLAGLQARGRTRIMEPVRSRNHTELMLASFGYNPERADSVLEVGEHVRLKATRISIPSDLSSAAFFLVAATIAPGSELVIEGVGVNPSRTGVLDILQLMGADIVLENTRQMGCEPVADLRVRATRLKGIKIPERLVPLAIDELPVLCIAAACAEGETVLTGAAELRVKESDRLDAMGSGLRMLGVSVEMRQDGLRIQGEPGRHVFSGGTVDSRGDHRIAMAFAVASLRARDRLRILNCACVATSFPGFVELACSTGFDLDTTDDSNDCE